MQGDLQRLLERPEGQLLARKSSRIGPRELANQLIGFANADGGALLLGVEDGTVEGFRRYQGKADSLLTSALALCNPPVRLQARWIPCVPWTWPATRFPSRWASSVMASSSAWLY